MNKRSKEPMRFAVCINNDGYPASLEVGKLYRVIPDVAASSHGYVRIIDESGDDYGYTVERFFVLEVPLALQKALCAGSPVTRRPSKAPLQPAAPRSAKALTRTLDSR